MHVLLFDRSQLRLHAIAPGLPFELEDTLAGFAADEDEAQEATSFAAPPIGEKLETPANRQGRFVTKPLKSLARPTGLEPVFPP
jgi:hypothetical protein